MFEHRSQSQKCPIGGESFALASFPLMEVCSLFSRGNRKSLPPASHSKDAAQLGFAHFGRRFRTMAIFPFVEDGVAGGGSASGRRLSIWLRRRRSSHFLVL